MKDHQELAENFSTLGANINIRAIKQGFERNISIIIDAKMLLKH